MSSAATTDSATSENQTRADADSDGGDGRETGVFPMSADPAYPDAIPAIVSDTERAEPVERAPGRVSAAATVAVAVAGVAVLGSHPIAILLGVFGSVLTLGAFVARSRRILFGATALFVAMGVVGGLSTGLRVGVAGVLTGVLVLDLGTYALSIGEAMGRTASTRRVELVNAATSVALAGVAGIATLVLASVPVPTLSVEALLALLFGSTLLFAATRP